MFAIFKQQAQKIFACLFKRFSMAATGQSRRHDRETTVDHALIRGLVTAATGDEPVRNSVCGA